MTLKQWVNLTKDDKWLGGGIDSTQRLGALRVKLTFKNTDLLPVLRRYRVVPLDGCIEYTKHEKGRHLPFRGKDMEGTFLVNSERTVEREITLPAAGGNLYKIEVEGGGAVNDGAPQIEVRRRLFYKVVTMAGAVPPTWSDLEDVFKKVESKFAIELVRIGNVETIDGQEVVSANDEDRDAFFAKHKDVFDLGEHRSHAFVIICAKKVVRVMTEGFEDARMSVDLPPRGEPPDPIDSQIGRATSRPLRRGFEPDEDEGRTWLGPTVNCKFVPDHGTTVAVPLPRDSVYAKGESLHYKIASDQMVVAQTEVTQPGTFVVSGNIQVTRETGGFQNSYYRAVVVGFAGADPATDFHCLVHEIGHMIGLAANGPKVAWQPDKHGEFYEKMGHTGSHCKTAAEGSLSFDAKDETWTGKPGCVMFGSTGTSQANMAPDTFCDACAEQVRKVDLGAAALKRA